jgi:hypothetical protein
MMNVPAELKFGPTYCPPVPMLPVELEVIDLEQYPRPFIRLQL